jgi:hypothetical protein
LRFFYKALHESFECQQVSINTSLQEMLDQALKVWRWNSNKKEEFLFHTTLRYLIHRTECYEGGRLEELSAHLGDLYENKGGPDLIPNGGYHAVLEALQHRIAGNDDTNIRLGCAVESIEYCTQASSTKNDDNKVQIPLQTNTDDGHNPSSVVMGDGPASNIKAQRLIVMVKEFFKYHQGYFSRALQSAFLGW